MIILGISCYYHDSAAVIIKDGVIIAGAQEERFTRKKHDNSFPTNAITFCLRWLNLSANDIDSVAFYEKPIIKFERVIFQHLETFPKSRKTFVDTISSWFDYKLQIPKILKKEIGYTGKVVYIPHHLSHAASSYYLSGFDNSVIVTIDGVGEWATTTIGVGIGKEIRIDKEIRFPHSLGLLYSTLTAYLGFTVNDAEYKVMGLAAYGNPKPFKKQFDELITTFDDGSYALNMKYFDYTWADHMPSKKMTNLFGFPPRTPESKMENQYANIAASLQEKTEEVIFNLVTAAQKVYKKDSLCLSGGVALNSVTNGKILKNTPFKHIYIPPDPGDGGGALGAALYTHTQTTNTLPDIHFFPSIGPSFPDQQIQDILSSYHLTYRYIDEKKQLIDTVSDLLAKQKIIGWFEGRMEWGPRALGNRSILASAAKVEMKDIINSKVKHRELFRPFAPVILDKHVKKYFESDTNLSESAKYMLLVYKFKQKGKKEAPATVHVDGTGRLQVIERKNNELYYDVIEAYGKKTGSPIIINTSFNVRGEPIVCTPKDAVECFLKTDIDYVVIGQFIVKKGKHD
jgi:carbamoyltransferase